jgi:hypothetical protein
MRRGRWLESDFQKSWHGHWSRTSTMIGCNKNDIECLHFHTYVVICFRYKSKSLLERSDCTTAHSQHDRATCIPLQMILCLSNDRTASEKRCVLNTSRSSNVEFNRYHKDDIPPVPNWFDIPRKIKFATMLFPTMLLQALVCFLVRLEEVSVFFLNDAFSTFSTRSLLGGEVRSNGRQI